MNTRLTPVFTLLTVAALATSASCFAAEKFTFLTNWYAQAEHGGFYQAQATGQHGGYDDPWGDYLYAGPFLRR